MKTIKKASGTRACMIQASHSHFHPLRKMTMNPMQAIPLAIPTKNPRADRSVLSGAPPKKPILPSRTPPAMPTINPTSPLRITVATALIPSLSLSEVWSSVRWRNRISTRSTKLKRPASNPSIGPRLLVKKMQIN